MMFIDADGAILGKLASHVAKNLLLGENIIVLNAEKSVVTGNKKSILAHYKEDFDRGHRYTGPFFPKEPHMILKRTVRGMLPRKRDRGKLAYKRLIVHLGVPDEFKDKQLTRVPKTLLESGNAPSFISLTEISKFLGWRPKV
ncbi:MAG: 50S ribosomal protein L13 [Candidatus Altiarchaeota archaeon]|nr:50S ribosomal protein L13 [Candidatus Altiarchaeota archaeon]